MRKGKDTNNTDRRWGRKRKDVAMLNLQRVRQWFHCSYFRAIANERVYVEVKWVAHVLFRGGG